MRDRCPGTSVSERFLLGWPAADMAVCPDRNCTAPWRYVAGESVEKSPESAIMGAKSEKNGETAVQPVGVIDIEKYRGLTDHIRGDQVVLTEERKKHIVERRGESEFEALRPYFSETLRDPDYIFRDKDEKRANTALVCKKIKQDGRYVNVVLRLAVETDAEHFQHSVITAMFRGEKSMRRTKRTHELIYEKDGNT